MSRTLVFVYGTLTDPKQVDSVLDSWGFVGAATLDGLHRVAGEYPTLAPGGTVGGRLLETPEISTLDAYEGVDRGLYCRVSVPVLGGDSAAVYIGDPALLDAPAEWPGEEAADFEDRVRGYLAAHEVVVRPANSQKTSSNDR